MTGDQAHALPCFLLLLCLATVASARLVQEGGSTACKSLSPDGIQRLTLRSPPITFRPGDVMNKFFMVEGPKGHFGIRDFLAELVDENGVSVPLSEVYLHHWVMLEQVVRKKHLARHVNHLLKRLKGQRHSMHYHATDTASLEARGTGKIRGSDFERALTFMGKGGETRKTFSNLPAPYAEECGNPRDIPEGFEHVWMLNVHGLDTRGAVDRMGCTDCRCALFNATTNEKGQPLPEGYLGGLDCCTDERRCAVKEGFNGEQRTIYLQANEGFLLRKVDPKVGDRLDGRQFSLTSQFEGHVFSTAVPRFCKYTWEYVEWDECVIPVTSLQMDITDREGSGEGMIEFTVDGCGDVDPNSEDCVDMQVATLISPIGGDVVVAVSHLHAASINSTLWGEDGRLICNSAPIYGEGHEAGNEQGYVVGITACHGMPGSRNAPKIKQGEKLKYVVQYTKVGGPHTGVMGLIFVKLGTSGVAASY